MPRYIDAEKTKEHKFDEVQFERYFESVISSGLANADDVVYAYKVGYNEAIDRIADFEPTVDMEKIAVEYCMKHSLVMISMASYETLVAYYGRRNGLLFDERIDDGDGS